MSLILGIETSCDETGLAVVKDGTTVLSNVVISQIDTHRAFGGVVPEIASRMHTEVIYQLTQRALEEAGLSATRGAAPVDAIAATFGPGLMGSLLVGLSFGRAAAAAWHIPFLPVHHIEGHLFSVFLGERRPEYPFLALVVSGGHTQIIRCRAPHQYQVLGTTRDDAVGECFDKVARLLNLPYPGGPSIQKAAAEGDDNAYSFPIGLSAKSTLDFSYSGLKTAVLYALREHPDAPVADVAASFQRAAVDALILKTAAALEETGIHRLVIAGGVAANRRLRESAAGLDAKLFLPDMAYCVDNGAMIAAAAASRLTHQCSLPPDIPAAATITLMDSAGN
ncbi:MAG TPA: tRNA (adenosine(37)-N6)-threonylcarbamoyltransferase complex transferase subunit TsaD [Candidatus Hydrogenedentes bacterium]|nr:MAG: tRNA N6-adenosine threonylcarbamoyltransferase [Candidatus Hydrogenedentes bacterium ADurb.Bin101]HOC69223.1 tRNA (adenosine(37)-N6)-threonylcarbamoyltransferase complex transferase subunit TsaD [Candidatus Hydrogenedentota bacterium]HQN01275.1 tRNA (adenosine(37)-N6)-threonylcarbamoyltransferase complex transferase subunit TsaD [Candidatus Hydrogenedentota bacterium]